MPLLLEKARAHSIRHVREEEESKNHPRFVPPQPGTKNMEKVKMLAPTGRPMIKFVDVEGQFINKRESLKRIRNVEHRGAMKARRRNEASQDEQRRIEDKRRILVEARAARKAVKAAEKAQRETSRFQPGVGRSLVFS